MIYSVQICVIIFLAIHPMIEGGNFESSADLEVLLKTEEKVVETLQGFVKAEKRRLNFLESYLARLKKEYDIAIKDVEYYFGNPINAFTIIKRLGPDLEFAENIIRNKTDLKPPNAVFPTEEDIMNSVMGMMNMLNVYQLNITQLANGILSGTASQSQEVFTEAVTPLTASDCYTIGMKLYFLSQYQDAIAWLTEAYNKIKDVPCAICPVPIVDVLEHICQAYHELGNTKNFIEWSEILIHLRPDHPQSLLQARYIEVLRQKENVGYEDVGKKEDKDIPSARTGVILNFTDICIGRTKPNYTSKTMSCYYAHGPHKFLALAPLKAEILHRDPYLTMFHDVLSDEDIEAIQNISRPKFRDMCSKNVELRNGEYILLEDGSSDTVARASRRALHLSGLSAGKSQPLKVINYGIGGFYRQHWDTRLNKTRDSGQDNAGTVIFYLSDVEQGGATVFPLLNVTVFPKKGAAVFWMNQLPSGDGDLIMMHGACPVLRGEKWTALKYHHQSIERDCPLWSTETGIVTSEIYKKIIEDRKESYMRFMGIIEKKQNSKNIRRDSKL